MKVVYIGPHDRVVLPMPGGREREVVRLQQIDVPGDVGAALLEQPGNWRSAPAAKKPAKAGEEVRTDGAS